MTRLTGRVALVTGSGRGVGKAIAHKLSAEGGAVVVNDIEPGVAETTAGELVAAGRSATAFPGDVTDPGFANAVVAHALAEFGALHIVVNNAGFTWDGYLDAMTDEQWDTIQAVHVTAPFRLLRAAGPHLLSGAHASGSRSKVVNISSVSGLSGIAGQANYSTAKSGVLGLTRALAKEWGPRGVNVNAVAFGLIDTRLTQTKQNILGDKVRIGIPQAVRARFEESIPMGRAGTPEEAAGAVYLLCLPESDYVTGQTLVCGGGLT